MVYYWYYIALLMTARNLLHNMRGHVGRLRTTVNIGLRTRAVIVPWPWEESLGAATPSEGDLHGLVSSPGVGLA